MPELRTDWLTGRTVFIAENRAERPNEFSDAGSAGPESRLCPFCPGQEQITPPAVHELLDAQGRWQIRVVPNKYPAVTLEAVAAGGSVAGAGEPPAATSNASIAPAIGVQEVIIESPLHIDRTSALSLWEVRNVLGTYAQRLRHWRDDGRFAYGLLFKNQGPRAGASLAHLHSQLIALPAVPPAVAAELGRAEQDYREHRVCPYCRVLREELSGGERVVFQSESFVAFCPPASWQPYEVWLLPADHSSSFEDLRPEGLDQLAQAFRELILRIEAIMPEPAYNLLLRTAAWDGRGGDWSHWRMELLPRVTALAGFELASNFFINPVAPERAASKLRSV